MTNTERRVTPSQKRRLLWVLDKQNGNRPVEVSATVVKYAWDKQRHKYFSIPTVRKFGPHLLGEDCWTTEAEALTAQHQG